MKHITTLLFLLVFSATAFHARTLPYLHVAGEHVCAATGDTLYIHGVNLGNWLNPEGYMFRFPDGQCNAPHQIHELLCQMVGPYEARAFWQAFKDHYITRDDIRFIASTGANTVRLPFHYKLFTPEDYLGLNDPDEGFRLLDQAITWCKAEGLYVVLDMHDCPGGQTGDNIDDSYGYPYLFTSFEAQQQFITIWQRIARRYKGESTVLGYELMNEPIAHYFASDLDSLNACLMPLYSRTIAAIRRVDKRHIILLGGAQWNGNFAPLPARVDDSNILWACHRYWHQPDEDGIRDFIAWRDSTHIAMCMTETGHNTHEWYRTQSQTLRDNHIGVLWWPYKKLGNSCWMNAPVPDSWEVVRRFAAADRSTYQSIRTNRPSLDSCRQALTDYLHAIQYPNCTPEQAYLDAVR